jgi:hypothetical protein
MAESASTAHCEYGDQWSARVVVDCRLYTPLLSILGLWCSQCVWSLRARAVGDSHTLKTLGTAMVSEELSPLGLMTVTVGRDMAAAGCFVSLAVEKS